MANSKEITATVPFDIIKTFLPCSQQIALLHHASHFGLAKFPSLERLLSMRAVETQFLFDSSQTLLFRCEGTSQSLVSSLLPIMTHAVKKNEPAVAVKCLGPAKTQINEIIQDVNKMVERFGEHANTYTIIEKSIYSGEHKGSPPDQVHLREVPRYLDRIKDILKQLKGFWENVYSLLNTIRDKTFLKEDLVDKPDRKDEFLESVQKASEVWETCSRFCSKGAQIFRVQSYKFLEIDPGSLSHEAWEKEYYRVLKELRELNIFWRTCGTLTPNSNA